MVPGGFRRRTPEGNLMRKRGGVPVLLGLFRTGIMAGSNMSGQMFSRNTRLLSPAGPGSVLRFCVIRRPLQKWNLCSGTRRTPATPSPGAPWPPWL